MPDVNNNTTNNTTIIQRIIIIILPHTNHTPGNEIREQKKRNYLLKEITKRIRYGRFNWPRTAKTHFQHTKITYGDRDKFVPNVSDEKLETRRGKQPKKTGGGPRREDPRHDIKHLRSTEEEDEEE